MRSSVSRVTPGDSKHTGILHTQASVARFKSAGFGSGVCSPESVPPTLSNWYTERAWHFQSFPSFLLMTRCQMLIFSHLKELKQRVISRSTNFLTEVRSLLVRILSDIYRQNDIVFLGTQFQLAVSFTVEIFSEIWRKHTNLVVKAKEIFPKLVEANEIHVKLERKIDVTTFVTTNVTTFDKCCDMLWLLLWQMSQHCHNILTKISLLGKNVVTF